VKVDVAGEHEERFPGDETGRARAEIITSQKARSKMPFGNRPMYYTSVLIIIDRHSLERWGRELGIHSRKYNRPG